MLHCVSYHLQDAFTHNRPSVPHVELQESAHFKYKTRHVWVTKSMDITTAGEHRCRCRHCLQLQLPLPVSEVLFCSSHSRWIGDDRTGIWTPDDGWQVFETAERSGSARNAGWVARYNARRWVSLGASSGCWCATIACTWRGSWCLDYPSLGSREGGSDGFSDICNPRIVQRRWGYGVMTLDCRAYRTPTLMGIPLASRYGNASLSWGKWRIPSTPTLL